MLAGIFDSLLTSCVTLPIKLPAAQPSFPAATGDRLPVLVRRPGGLVDSPISSAPDSWVVASTAAGH
jgi:hypothetical protein